jgi:hypothetical protein
LSLTISAHRLAAATRANAMYAMMAAAAASYLVILAYRFPSIITAMTWDSDSAAGFDLAESLSNRGDSGPVKLTTSGQFVSLWFGLLTGRLPFHREIWMGAPMVAYFGACTVLVLTVCRVVSRPAALATAAMTVAASPRVLFLTVRAVTHTEAYLGTVLLGAALVWRWRRRSRLRIDLISAGATAVVIGALLASDPLLVVTGVVPFTLTAFLAWLGDRTRLGAARWATVTVVLAGAVAVVTTVLMRAVGFTALPVDAKVAALGDVWPHLHWLGRGVLRIGNGAGPNAADPTRPWQYAVVAGVVIPALLCAGFVLARELGSMATEPADVRHAVRRVHVLFWGTSAIASAGAFVVSTRAFDGGDQYFVTVLFSVAALVPVAVGALNGRRLQLACVAISVFCLASTYGVATGDVERQSGAAVTRDGDAVISIVESQGLTRGYGGYFDASSMTWRARYRIQVRPVLECGNPHGADLCPFFLMRIASWYRPHPGRTFLVVNPTGAFVVHEPAGLGPPVARYRAGALVVLVYPYDIASRFGPAPT